MITHAVPVIIPFFMAIGTAVMRNSMSGNESVPIEQRKAAEAHLRDYIATEIGSEGERVCLDALMGVVFDIQSFGARQQWREKLSKLPDGKAIPKGRFDSEDKRLQMIVKAGLKEEEKPQEEGPTIKAIPFKLFDNGVIIDQVLQGGKVRFAVLTQEDGEVTYLDQIPDEEGEVLYVPVENELCLKGDPPAVRLPSKAEEYKSLADLLAEIRTFIKYYLEVDELNLKLGSYYILLSWVYDKFHNLPYLRALGDTGTGKSRFLDTIGSLTYKPCFVAGAVTPAVIYRVIELYGGSLIIDEADFRSSDIHDEIVKILNCGFQRSSPVIRSQPTADGSWEPAPFSVFCPKILATRRKFKDDALENRMFTVVMRECVRSDIPYTLDDNFYEWARSIQNKLLMFRLRNLAKVKALTDMELNVDARLKQITIPMLSIMEEEDFKQDLMDIIETYQSEIFVDRSTRWEAEIIAAILKLHDQKSTQQFTMKEIAEVVNEERETDDKLSARKVGSVVRRSLYLKVSKLRNVYGIVWENNEKTILELAKRYDIL
jgi:hypothetical protein